jgi:hypothetical protein
MQSNDASAICGNLENSYLMQYVLTLVHRSASLADELGGILHTGFLVCALPDSRKFAPESNHNINKKSQVNLVRSQNHGARDGKIILKWPQRNECEGVEWMQMAQDRVI